MIETPKKNWKIVVFDQKGTPHGYHLSQGLVRLVLYLGPSLLVLFIAISFFASNIFDLKRNFELKQSSDNQQKILNENNELKNQVSALQKDLTQFEQRIILPASEQSTLALFTTTLGTQNITGNTTAKVEYDSFESAGKAKLNIRLINAQGGSSLNGYLVIIQYAASSLAFFPENLIGSKLTIDYNKGDSFSVARFKSVSATFPKPTGSKVHYKVILFNKTGDIILNQILGPYDL
jgi:hypothetical protein